MELETLEFLSGVSLFGTVASGSSLLFNTGAYFYHKSKQTIRGVHRGAFGEQNHYVYEHPVVCKRAFVSGALTGLFVLGTLFTDSLAEDKGRIPLVCVAAQNANKLDIVNGVAHISVSTNQNQDVTVGQTVAAIGYDDKQYFFLDADDNPNTIEYIGSAYNTAENIVKWHNAGIKIGSKMSLKQWSYFVDLQRVR